MTVPAQVNASRALARDERYAGSVDVAALERLRELAPQDLAADLRMYRDVGRQGWVEGRITGFLSLECRICENPFAWPLDAPVKLALAMSEEDEARLMESGEPLLVRDDVLRLHEIVEDEVLLALPMMPRCAACENARPLSEGLADHVETRAGPMAALKDLSTGLSFGGGFPTRRK